MRSFHYSDAVTGDRSAAVSELLEAIARDKRRFLELRGEQPALLLELERKALVDNCDASARIEGM
ncbi:MAG: hypothetical protein IJJ14_07210 [Coriobacteriales bacterium]|nr:hypothetical protein [Coriobacteriales bacterium]